MRLGLLTAVALAGLATLNMTATQAQTPEQANASIQAIQQAEDPSAVVEAYAKAFTAGQRNPRVLEAYVNRMIQLGMPELAFRQAHTLLSIEPGNAMAMAAVAYADARQGNMDKAVAGTLAAAQKAPDDPFIQSTAGQLAAWFDSNPQPTPPAAVKENIDRLRQLMADKEVFKNSYEMAKKELAELKADEQAATEAAPADEAPLTDVNPYVDIPPAAEAPSVYVEPPYVQAAPTYLAEPFYYYPPVYSTSVVYPRYYEPWWYGGGLFGSIFVSLDFDRHHHYRSFFPHRLFRFHRHDRDWRRADFDRDDFRRRQWWQRERFDGRERRLALRQARQADRQRAGALSRLFDGDRRTQQRALEPRTRIQPRNNEQPRLFQPRNVEPRTRVQPRAVQPRTVEPRTRVQPRTVEPRAVQPRAVQPRTAEPRTRVQPRAVQPRSVQPRAVQPRAVQPRSVQPRAVQPRSAQPRARIESRSAQPRSQPRMSNRGGGRGSSRSRSR